MGGDNHLSGTLVAKRLKRHYPEGRRAALILPYLVLLHVGFTKASRSPDCWCALTAPFHPYRSETGGINFYSTVPEVALAGRYPAHCPVELGLSSPIRNGWTRLSRFLIPMERLYHIWGTGVKSPPSPCSIWDKENTYEQKIFFMRIFFIKNIAVPMPFQQSPECWRTDSHANNVPARHRSSS